MNTLLQDFRYAARTLRKSPGFAAVAILTLALGIGATTAIFSVIDGVLLRPLPYEEPDRLFSVMEANRQDQPRRLSYPTFLDWREQADVFEGLAYVRGDDLLLRTDEGAQSLLGAYVSEGFFETLGARAALGRTLLAGEADGGTPVVVSHRYWQRELGGTADALGRPLTGPDGSYTIVGVMPPASYPVWADLWLPMTALPPGDPIFTRRDLHVDAEVVGRLERGVTPERAHVQLGAIAARIAAAYPEDAAEYTRAQLLPMRSVLVGDDVGSRLALFAAAVALVLLIACVNVANLLLARATTRERELAVRAALGAGRGRLVRQLLSESLLLALVGGALGAAIAAFAVDAFAAVAPGALPRLDEVGVDGRVLLFTLVLSAAAALLFGTLPALRAARPDLVTALKSGTPGSGADRRGVRLRGALVAGEVALTLMLLVGAALLLKSFWILRQERLGVEPERVAAVRIFPPSPRYDDPAAAAELFRRLEEATAALPGVEAAAVANHIPLGGAWMPSRVVVPGREPPERGEMALYRTISPGYFETLGIPVVAGRPLSRADLGGGAVLVDRALAREFFGEMDPVGQTITVHKAAQERVDFGEPVTATVVGVAGDVRHFGPGTDPPPTVYVPYTINPWGNTFVVARATGSAQALIPSLRRAVAGVDPDLPIAGPGFQTELRPLTDYLGMRTEQRRLETGLLAGFAALALALSLIGLFGVLSYVVAQRTREIGVRMALGATRAGVLRLIVRQALAIVAVGLLVGTAGALAATRLLEGSLYGVQRTDPAAFALAAALFAIAALAAAIAPARRATRVDPMVAMRNE